MADYFTQFSCVLDVGSAEHAAAAEGIRDQLADELDARDGVSLGFDMEPDPDLGAGALWISSDGYGDPEHVTTFALRCAEAFNLTGRWGFTWAFTCSKRRLNSFGGGALRLDLGARRTIDWVDCAQWLAIGLADPSTAPASDPTPTATGSGG